MGGRMLRHPKHRIYLRKEFSSFWLGRRFMRYRALLQKRCCTARGAIRAIIWMTFTTSNHRTHVQPAPDFE